MTIDSVDVDGETVMSLSQWLESEEAQIVQRYLEEKINQMLFSQDPTSPTFQSLAERLAWIGSRPEAKPFLEKEITVLHLSKETSIERCGWGKKAGNFIVDHAFEIGVGTFIVATAVGVAFAAGYTLSASIGGVVIAGTGSIFSKREQPDPSTSLSKRQPCTQSEWAAVQQGLPTSLPKVQLPSNTDEILVTNEGIWAAGQFFSTESLRKNSIFSSPYQQTIPETSLGSLWTARSSDWKTFHLYLSSQQALNSDVPYQTLGESALALGNYNQAIHDFDKAIEANPTNPLSYLERGAAHFSLGEYDRSLEDYQQFASQTETTSPLSVSDFCLGFAKGLPTGTYESGEGALLFLVDFVKHPIQTSKQAFDAISLLVDLVRKDELGAVAEALSPELYKLVTEWDTLPSAQRGELAGYAVGKLGGDVLIPGALAKVASKSVKSAQELVSVCKNLQIAQETLVLETAAGIGNGAKIAEVIQTGEKIAFFAEELGFTANETVQLKQAGTLQSTVMKRYDHLSPPIQESIARYKKARDILKPYAKKPMPEDQIRKLIHQTGMPTFPRPKGIPEDFLVMITDKSAGMEYVHPTNNHIRIRVMPGKPHSPNPSQQKPYVIQKTEEGALNKSGKTISADSPEAHIPIDEFIYRTNINGN